MPVPFNQADFLRLLDCLSDGVYVVDADRRIVAWSRGAERIAGYRSDEVLGACCHENILVHVDCDGHCLCRSQCPMQATMDDEREREAEAFLRHRDGHRVPVRLRTLPLNDERGAPYGAIQVFRELSEGMSALGRLKELDLSAFADGLTGLVNRDGLEMTMRRRLQRFADDEQEMPFGVIMLDIDRFHELNLRWGEAVGDRLLQMVAGTLKTNCRYGDVAGRWDGQEFVIITGAVKRGVLYTMAERLR
ncbi:MAG: diguanylate cyclase, partial [Pseudomonadales bacterium]|nr:diguanylate cyclase [Pseudomonadales bacterium]